MFNTLWGFLSIAVVCGVITSWINVNGSKPAKEKLARLQVALDDVEDLQVEMEKKISDRDSIIQKLEERVRILERIVTDPRHRLDEEFRNLKS